MGMAVTDGSRGSVVGQALEFGTETLRVRMDPGAALAMRVAVQVGGAWRDVATLQWGRLVVADAAQDAGAPVDGLQTRTYQLAATSGSATGDGISLTGAIDEPALGPCPFGIDLRRAGEREIAITYWAAPERGCRLVHFGGPYLTFEPGFAERKDDALFPGLEWLLGDERSSDTANAAARFARRTAPHPYKVAIPLMAIAADGVAVGLWWDPNQLWCNAHAYPGAEFALPDLEADAPDGTPRPHRVGLFAPTPASSWTTENSTHAHKPYAVPAGARLTIAATLYAGPAPRFSGRAAADAAPRPVAAHGSLAVLDRWLDSHGPRITTADENAALNRPRSSNAAIRPQSSPAPQGAAARTHEMDDPPGFSRRGAAMTFQGQVGVSYESQAISPPRSWQEALDLCLRSYAAQCWDAEAEGWHHTLADPWGPRYEPGVALQLWQASRRRLPAAPHHAREIVHAAVRRGTARGSGEPVPHLDLAFCYGGLEAALRATRQALADLIARQRPDGGFPFVPLEDRQQNLGQRGDTASGITGEAATRLLRFARMTGDGAARDAGIRAMDYLRTQPRPEGAQTWELQVHVPDILAAAYGVAASVEAYLLTDDDAYLDEAERWAFAALPFIYLWNPLFRPIMRYGTVPVFGATYFDAQAWFGVLVQWNGLVYARALLNLAALRPYARWRAVAEGVITCGVQQQMPDGPLVGMYPDAFSVIRGDEEYTWWLTPTLLGQPLLALLGQPVEPYTLIGRAAGGRRYHVTAADPLAGLTVTGDSLAVTLRAVDDAGCILLGGPGMEATRAITVDGDAVPEVEDLDAAVAGYRRLPDGGYLLVKPGRAGQVRIACAW
jgi:hypothetical protein